MINEETQRKLRNMKMEPLVEALQNQQSDLESYAPLDFDSRLTLAIDECYSVKLDDRIRRLTHIAKFRYPDADVHTLIMQGRGFSREEILGYASCGYIERHKNLIINGFTGVGKTHLACALGKEACRHLYRVKYFRMPELMEQFNYGTEVGRSVASIVKKFSGYDLLIIDEWLLEMPTEVEQQYLLESWKAGTMPILLFSVPSTKAQNGIRASVMGFWPMRLWTESFTMPTTSIADQ